VDSEAIDCSAFKELRVGLTGQGGGEYAKLTLTVMFLTPFGTFEETSANSSPNINELYYAENRTNATGAVAFTVPVFGPKFRLRLRLSDPLFPGGPTTIALSKPLWVYMVN